MGQSCRLTCYCISLSGMVQCRRSDDEGLVREVLLSKESLIGSGAQDPKRVPTISCNKFPGFSGSFTSFADQQIVWSPFLMDQWNIFVTLSSLR
ncbi:hypothetical protein CEXT_35621 [Caerostris extrusa]|uniref:Uncharacterized protein n=1 Tax=Caerostris extrusa TaxID=172846 RepID=A0AAV4NZG7_CAEEX|nr:hypothetical protein CEXT_35621 [Caerostris extrusa]